MNSNMTISKKTKGPNKANAPIIARNVIVISLIKKSIQRCSLKSLCLHNYYIHK